MNKTNTKKEITLEVLADMIASVDSKVASLDSKVTSLDSKVTVLAEDLEALAISTAKGFAAVAEDIEMLKEDGLFMRRNILSMGDRFVTRAEFDLSLQKR